MFLPRRPCPRVPPGQPASAMAAYGQTQYSAGIQQATAYTAYPPPAQAYGIPSYSEYLTKPLLSPGSLTSWSSFCPNASVKCRKRHAANLILDWRQRRTDTFNTVQVLEAMSRPLLIARVKNLTQAGLEKMET